MTKKTIPCVRMCSMFLFHSELDISVCPLQHDDNMMSHPSVYTFLLPLHNNPKLSGLTHRYYYYTLQETTSL